MLLFDFGIVPMYFCYFSLQDSSAKMEILREAVKIINDKFPLDSEFEIYEKETLCSITKKKWEEAYIRENASADGYSRKSVYYDFNSL